MSRVCDAVFVIFFAHTVFVDIDCSLCGKVHLTVSPYSFLELNWITDCYNENVPDEIILSRTNLKEKHEDPAVLLKINPSDIPSGYYKTKIKFGQPYLPGGWDSNDVNISHAPGPHCFPYWISSFIGNKILDSRCFAIQPTWMADNREILGNRNIESILIPGTHNSGSFNGSTFIDKFILNQDRDIWTQLVFGIRYLDFRIGYYGKEGFYLNHDKFKIQEVRPLFQQIKKFLQASPREVVILDFHRFPFPSEFRPHLHTLFVEIVREDLGEFTVPVMNGRRGPTLNDIWATNKSLIISYNNIRDINSVDDKPWLWHPLHQYWANTKSLSFLKQFIKESIADHDSDRRTNPLWSLMAELTPRPVDIIFGTYNLKKLAQDTNRNITKWFRNEFGSNSNIVATDYFLGNDIIDIAIDINTRHNRSKTFS